MSPRTNRSQGFEVTFKSSRLELLGTVPFERTNAVIKAQQVAGFPFLYNIPPCFKKQHPLLIFAGSKSCCWKSDEINFQFPSSMQSYPPDSVKVWCDPPDAKQSPDVSRGKNIKLNNTNICTQHSRHAFATGRIPEIIWRAIREIKQRTIFQLWRVQFLSTY